MGCVAQIKPIRKASMSVPKPFLPQLKKEQQYRESLKPVSLFPKDMLIGYVTTPAPTIKVKSKKNKK